MQIRRLLRKFKMLNAKGHATKAIEGRKGSRRRWMGISHGFHVVERDDGSEGSTLVAQREQVGTSEVWLFGVSDRYMGDALTKYLQSHLFNERLSEHEIGTRAKETMKKGYGLVRPAMHEMERRDGIGGSTSAVVIRGERFVAADFGGYRAVVCKAGVAIQIGGRHQNPAKAKFSISSITEKLFGSPAQVKENKFNKKSGLVLVAEKVQADTEFLILASDGVWEVMLNQEAVDLIWHIEGAQEAAECLAEEAINRMSKSSISCTVIRFH